MKGIGKAIIYSIIKILFANLTNYKTDNNLLNFKYLFFEKIVKTVIYKIVHKNIFNS